MIFACAGTASSAPNSKRRAQRYSEVAASVIRTLMRSIPGLAALGAARYKIFNVGSGRSAGLAGSSAKRRSEKPRPCRVRSAARSLVNASKRFSWSASPVRLRNGATPTAMLDSKQRHGIAARSAFGAPNAPPSRRGDDRAGAYRGAVVCCAAREFFVEEGFSTAHRRDSVRHAESANFFEKRMNLGAVGRRTGTRQPQLLECSRTVIRILLAERCGGLGGLGSATEQGQRRH